MSNLNTELKTLLERRKSLKADHILMRDQVSTMRDEVASELQHEAGERVRIRVMRNADYMSYQEMLVDGLKGARVRNQNEILATLMQLRPEQLAQLIQSNDLESFEELTHFGPSAPGRSSMRFARAWIRWPWRSPPSKTELPSS